jgi:hypothetical protein
MACSNELDHCFPIEHRIGDDGAGARARHKRIQLFEDLPADKGGENGNDSLS